MALTMQSVGTEAESIVVTQVLTGQHFNLRRGEDSRVDMVVDQNGITIQYEDNNRADATQRVLKITYSDSKLTFADTNRTFAQIDFNIVSGNSRGAGSTFDVERSAGSQQFKITNTDLRFYNKYLNHADEVPAEVYYIHTQTSHGEDTWKLSTST